MRNANKREGFGNRLRLLVARLTCNPRFTSRPVARTRMRLLNMGILVIFLMMDVIVLMIIVMIKRESRLKQACTFIISFASACCLALAVMSFQMHLDGLFKNPQIWPAFLWIVLGSVGFAIAIASRTAPGLIIIPCWLVATPLGVYGLIFREVFAAELGAAIAAVGLGMNHSLGRWRRAVMETPADK